MTLTELQNIATFRGPIYVKQNNQLVGVADLYRVFHLDKPDEWYVWEYDTQLVKRIGEY